MDSSIAERIKECRVKAKLSQATVADHLGMNRSTYARHEKSGKFDFTYIPIMASLFGVPYGYILHGTLEPSLHDSQPIDFTPSGGGSGVLGTPEPTFIVEDELGVLQDNEKNMIKIFRRLSTEDKKFLENFLEERQKR